MSLRKSDQVVGTGIHIKPELPYFAAGNPVPVLPGVAHGKALVGSVHHLPSLPQPALLLRPAVPMLQQACAAPLPAFVCMQSVPYCASMALETM